MHFQWYPGHMTKAKRMMQENIKLIDLVIELVDARLPVSSRNPDIDELGKNKARLILLNKADLAEEKWNDAWAEYFKKKGYSVVKVNSKRGGGIKSIQGVIQEACKEKIERDRKRGILNRPVRAMVVGIPNVGKSTFLNHVMGQKIAIMSDKAQTTRNKIMGIYTTDKEQIVFIDTPGIHKPKTALGDFMVESAYSTLREVDTVLFMVPADEPRGKGDNMIIERLKQAKVPVILVINKIDKVHPDQLLEQIEDFRTQMDFKEIIPISALQGNNVSHLVDVLSDNLEEGFQYFPADQITDHPERFLVSEMIREKVLQLTREEIPHSVAVVIDEMKRDEETDKIHIRATIMVERDSQKGIVIGKQGSMLKKIGTLARKDIEVMLGDKVFLETWVKVKKNWRDKKLDLADFGYNEKEY